VCDAVNYKLKASEDERLTAKCLECRNPSWSAEIDLRW